MVDLFGRAKSVGLSHVKSWLPNGKQKGAEWVCLNPTRKDNKEGSFSINLDTGKWSDFAYNEGGNDVISLYAYLNRSEMEDRARDKYKNFEGGVQAEAARDILTSHDENYWPDNNDDFTPPKKSGDFWSGYRAVNRGIENPPDPVKSIKYLEKHFGTYQNHWNFLDKKGFIILIVARFNQDGKKNDRPFTLWTNGTEKRWRAKNLQGIKFPLFNRPDFDKKQNLPILMVEGQKCSEASDTILSEDFVNTTIYGGIKNADLEPLRGRTVYYWFDPDVAGRRKLSQLRDAIKDLDVIFKAIHSPTGKEKGWDIADAIKEGWTKEALLQHILAEIIEDDKFLDDDSLPFRIVGQTATHIFFFPKETKLIMSFKRTALGKANLMNLMSREEWGTYYSKADGGIAWDSAMNDMIRRAAEKEIYSSNIVRGSGAWIESGKLVINTGKNLIIEGKKLDLFQKDTKYIYEKKHHINYSTAGALNTSEASNLLEIIKRLDFRYREFSYYLAGWLLLAPFGGALDWRPHLWLTGKHGTGKSYILDKIVFPLGGDFGVKLLGASTTAGVRQALGNSSKPVYVDEAESDTLKQKEKIEDLLTMARQASSGAEGSAGILHGTQDGEGFNWIVRSMFLFASIGAAMVHNADKSRLTLISLNSYRKEDIEKREEQFKELKKWVSTITPTWADGFHARTLTIFPEVQKAIDIFIEQTTKIMGTRREGDQFGTLMAGAYMIENEVAPSAAEARNYLQEFDLKASIEENSIDKDDSEICIDTILSYMIDVDNTKHSIGIWVRYWFFTQDQTGLIPLSEFSDISTKFDPQRVKRVLEEHGIKPLHRDGNYLKIANNHPALQKILKPTPWETNYHNIIGRLDYCIGNDGPSFFAGLQKRSKKLDVEKILQDEIPF